MFAPSSPHSSPDASSSSPAARRFRQPSRYDNLTANTSSEHVSYSGNAASTPRGRIGGPSPSSPFTMNNTNATNTASRPSTSGGMAASCGGGGGGEFAKEERTLVGKGTVGCGAALWEAEQAAVKTRHLAEWERARTQQIEAEAEKRREAKKEAERQVRMERDKHRQMFLDNRFTTVFFTKQVVTPPTIAATSTQSAFLPPVAAPGTPTSPTTAAGAAGGGEGASAQPQSQPVVVETTSVVRARSAAEQRERSILPASATSPLRQSHYKAVVKKKAEFMKEKAQWAAARSKELLEQRAYVDRMRAAGPSSASASTSLPSSARGTIGNGSGDGFGATGWNNENNKSGGGFSPPYRMSNAGNENSFASPHGNRPNSASTRNGGGGNIVVPTPPPPRSTTMGANGSSSASLNPHRRQLSPFTDNSTAVAAQQRRSPPRSSSPPPEVAEECRRSVMAERAAIERDILSDRENSLTRNRESHHLVTQMHYNTFKSVKALEEENTKVVSSIREAKEERETRRKQLTKEIREEKYKYQKMEREQQLAARQAAKIQRHRSVRTNAEKEAESEKQRLREREALREEELRALQASAESRRVNCVCSRDGRRSPLGQTLNSTTDHHSSSGGNNSPFAFASRNAGRKESSWPSQRQGSSSFGRRDTANRSVSPHTDDGR